MSILDKKYILNNNKYELLLSERGTVESLLLKEDPSAMNWVIPPTYMREAGYHAEDKWFGEWTATIDGKVIHSFDLTPEVQSEDPESVVVTYPIGALVVKIHYRLEEEVVKWRISCNNSSGQSVTIQGLHVWFSLAYVMYRDEDVLRNTRQSCALYPHFGGDFTKFAAVRRSNEAPHLAIYSTEGRAVTLGSYCQYENRFLEQVSPSLDGVLYHRLSLVEDGSSLVESANVDWIYGDGYSSLTLDAGDSSSWEFVIASFDNQDHFYKQSSTYGHPNWTYTSVIVAGGMFEATLQLPEGRTLKSVKLYSKGIGVTRVQVEDVTELFTAGLQKSRTYVVSLMQDRPGERKLELVLDNGLIDVLIWNVLEPLDHILAKRAEWLCRNSYDGNGQSARPHAFLPLSNQGESLGKLTFVLMNNTLKSPVQEQIAIAECSAVLDMRQHWFEDGVFSKPRSLYGSFYRIFDLDYIAHVYYLLSRMDSSMLKLHTPHTYLEWAAEVMCVRLNPECHDRQREQDETSLSGVFILYIKDLMQSLKDEGMQEWHARLQQLWNEFGLRLEQGTHGLRGAITEHFYDNAGFGPTCETLCHLDMKEEAEQYAQLIAANIGFSNDYRAQNPDRWWEALSYMIHCLWGGLVAGSARVAYESLGNPEYLEASYRATMAVFNGYDWNVTSTPRHLEPGEAASTYSVAAPNLNMPSLSRNRFGQSIFKDHSDPLFSQLFAGATGDDWDMGEELVSYLLGFGTTTYLYYDAKGTIRCVNGYIVQEEEGWIVTSYAAYPKKFVLLEQQLQFVADPSELVRRVLFQDGKFRALEKVPV